MSTWRELFPEGRHIFFEGEDPAAFIDEIRRLYGLDPLLFEVTQWRDGEIICNYRNPDPAGLIREFPFKTDAFTVSLDCPPAILDEIYTGYPMGS